tara:strand:- start:4372 stop:5532 length:1161 start_codon:yes stop_codon:yes gene_type:complete
MSEKVKQEGEFKVKPRAKKLVDKKPVETIKVDLNKTKPEEQVELQKVVLKEEVVEKVVEKIILEDKKEEAKPVIQEITDETSGTDSDGVVGSTEATNAPQEQKEILQERETQKKLPENIEKLVSFMKETGGTIEDYTRLNADYSNVDDSVLLREYYKQSKPHLNLDEVEFMLEDEFSYDEDMDEERDVRKKKLAMKEEIAKAKSFLEETKSKYYDEIKLRPGVTQDQQRAMDFYNKHSKEQSNAMEKHELFKSTTKDFFNEKFKGFEFKVNEKRFRYGLSKPSDVADNQSNISNLVQKFMDDKGNIKDYEGYHKAIYMAENSDTVANHFYEQGKTDAIRDINAKSKNISNEPRATSGGDVYINGLKVKAINGVDSSKLKIKTKNNT